MEKVVVTGATGHIGNVLVRELVKKGYQVKAFVLSGENTEHIQTLGIEIVHGDVRDKSSLEEAFRGAEIVFHLAGKIEIGNGNKKEMHEINVEGTKNVLNACKEEKVKKLIYTSSVHAIPERPKGEKIEETNTFSETLVKGTYAKTKAEATKYLLANRGEELELIIVHPSGVIGPYEYIPSNLGQLIMDCANKKIGAYLAGGYNFVDVRDVVAGIIAAKEKGRNGECYILAGYCMSVKELMMQIQEITGVKAPKFKLARWFVYLTGFLSEAYYKMIKTKALFTSYAVYTLGTNSNFSNQKAQKELGYTIRDSKDTLVDTIAWLKKEGRIESKKIEKK